MWPLEPLIPKPENLARVSGDVLRAAAASFRAILVSRDGRWSGFGATGLGVSGFMGLGLGIWGLVMGFISSWCFPASGL